jgi:hypothetical protein
MKEKLFIDTWGWIVIHNKREPKHDEVNAFYREFRAQGGASTQLIMCLMKQ